LRKWIPLLLVLIALGYSTFQFVGKKQEEKKVNATYESAISKMGIQVGGKAPILALLSLDGKKVNIPLSGGKTTVLNFWATWCPPCQDEIPVLQKFTKEHSDQFNVIGVADYIGEKKNINYVKNFAVKNKMTYQILLDETSDNFKRYGVLTIPTTFFIDKNGKVIFKKIGPLEEKDFDLLLK
jgi:thiol-disulfide isomerase/thioredoxin